MVLGAAFALAVAVTGCASGNGSATGPEAGADAGSGDPNTSATPTEYRGSITVFAAASLTATFTELGRRFEELHPSAGIRFNFAGSSSLATQIIEGAPADVFASADTATMSEVRDAKLLAGAPVTFARNTLAIVVPPGNPASVASFADLARPGTRTVVCSPQVPCGAATAKVEVSSGIALAPVSEESSVTDVLGKVSSGEADAGIVYVTDVKAAGSHVESVPFPEAASVVNEYPIAPVAGGSARELAGAFIDFVTGASGRAVLAAAGFGTR
jgi:molybdate transport system substrate-binding protein